MALSHLKENPLSRKKVSNNQVRGIARKRMGILVRLSEKEALGGNMARAKRYMTLARRISARNKVPMPPGALYCRRCSTPLVPGSNCRVRLRDHRVVTHCLECGSVRRAPYLMEIKERRTCRQGR
ncbi:MAG: ribonuclease P protein component 4 [Euryarchaeota archaeon]|nr:ribonuclease P protein component 4 [Euryarchaeota archaeon]